MAVITVSSKFQVVIPREIRERARLTPGQKIQAFLFEGRIELVPVEHTRATRGFLRGIDTDVPREPDRK
jgi:AbrB family looped-hinge helix DNA binding protein